MTGDDRTEGASEHPGVGSRVGRYRIERVLAEGGMGRVYAAVQDRTERRVALKVMRAELATDEFRRRFEYEAEILASLHHEGIARVYESGIHADAAGRLLPYFAMEYVEGARGLTRYADEERLDVRGRLDLFRQLCAAVHHGHRSGIIHRDLKPSNVLVDERGRVKVIDFGLARAADVEASPLAPESQVAKLVGTLQYLSPEQCGGDPTDLDVRSDVYALGVLLYELLCGTLPYDVRETPVLEATRVIRESMPTPPHRAGRKLRRDLAAIVLKALAKERERRYASAEELRRDIERYLDGRPILATPPTPLYRTVRWVGRHPRRSIAMASIVTMLLVVLAWGIASSRQASRLFDRRVADARILRDRGDLEGAIGALRRARDIRPNSPVAGALLAAFRSEQEQLLDEARAERQRERRRRDALAKVEEGLRLFEEYRALDDEVERRRSERAELAKGIDRLAPAHEKRPLWDLDRWIETAPARKRRLLGDVLNALHAAKVIAEEEMDEANRALADVHFARFLSAEEAEDRDEADLLRIEVGRFDTEGRYAERLNGFGSFRLHTEPQGAEVHVFRYVERDRRLWPCPFDLAASAPSPRPEWSEPDPPERETPYEAPSVHEDLEFDDRHRLGTTPLEHAELPPGSYLLVIRKEGCVDVRYPILIRRGKDSSPSKPIRVWSESEHPGPDRWVQIPPGRSIVGGDPDAGPRWPRTELHVDGFFLSRFEVTEEEYLEFVNDPETIGEVIRLSEEKNILRRVPRESNDSGLYWDFHEDGPRYSIPDDRKDWPVFGVSWEDASAYVEWWGRKAAERGDPWEYSLPTEAEWERAARGADGRIFPWGNGFDWSFCHGGLSRPGPRNPDARGTFPADESPFGVRDLGGSIREWCGLPSPTHRGAVLKGGAWPNVTSDFFRAERHYMNNDSTVSSDYGFRLACRPRATSRPPLPPVPPEDVLFFADFETGDLGAWRLLGEGWSVEEGALRGSLAAGGGRIHAATGEASWTDVTIEADVRLLDGEQRWLHFRWVDPGSVDSDRYSVYLDTAGNVGFFRTLAGETVRIAQGSFANRIGSWNRLRLRIAGAEFAVSIDGERTIETWDDSIPAGAIALEGTGGAAAPHAVEFDNVRVTRLRRDRMPSRTCRGGSVGLGGAGRDAPARVLSVNGSTGDESGVVTVSIGEAVDLAIEAPPDGPDGARFVVYAWSGIPSEETVTPQPAGLGTMCFPTPAVRAVPRPDVIFGNLEGHPELGEPDRVPEPAPGPVHRIATGFPYRMAGTFQGIVQDEGSVSAEKLSVTNAVILVAR